MANTLSQYIGQIIDRRNQELHQRLAPLIPLLQADLAETKRKAEIERQKQLRISDYGAMIGSNFDEETSAEFLQGVGAIQTTEGVDAYYKQFTNRKQLGKEIDNRVAVLRQMGLPDELLTEAEQAMSSVDDPASMDKISAMFAEKTNYSIEKLRDNAQMRGAKFGSDFEDGLKLYDNDPQAAVGYAMDKEAAREAASRPRGGGGGSGGGGVQQGEIYSVTEETKKAINRTYFTDSKGQWVKMVMNGNVYKVPATVGSDGRLYVVGEQGTYLINPSNCSAPSTTAKFQASPKFVDRYFGGVETAGGDNTKPQGTGNNKPAALPLGTTEGW